TCLDLCIGSILTWHEMQPLLFSRASSGVCPRRLSSESSACAGMATSRHVASAMAAYMAATNDLEDEQHIGPCLKKRIGLVDVTKAAEGLKHRDERFQDDIVVQQRPVFEAETDVDADITLDGRLLQQYFQHLGLDEANVIDIADGLQRRCDLGTGP